VTFTARQVATLAAALVTMGVAGPIGVARLSAPEPQPDLESRIESRVMASSLGRIEGLVTQIAAGVGELKSRVTALETKVEVLGVANERQSNAIDELREKVARLDPAK
jgi:TolA-binding protein